MAIYIDPAMVPDLDNIDSRVFKYLIQKHKGQLARWAKCKDYYEGRHDILAHKVDDDDDVVRFNVNYAKYVVDVGLGYYLGEPVKYNSDKADKADKQRKELEGGVKASIKNGSVKLYDPDLSQKLDISRIQDVYDNETISEIDSKIGKAIGIYGEAYEQLYANSDENPEPRSTVVNPMNCIMVRDNTVEHNKLFAIIYEIQEDLNESKYYSITVCNDHNTKEYRSRDLDNFEFYLVEGSEQEHYFGEVPVVEYQNNDERQGDFEQIIPMQDALNELFSDRVTDKKKATELMQSDFEIIDDRLRGKLPPGQFYQIKMTFNPVSATHWIKKNFFDIEDENVLTHSSNYVNNRFIDAAYRARMERRKKVDPEGYRVYGLGEWGEVGGLILTNYVVEDFNTDHSNFDYVVNAQDFGFNHANALLEVAFKDGELYICKELYVYEKDTNEIIQMAAEKQFDKKLNMYCDSAEPDRIKMWQKAGYKRARGVLKEPGSVHAQIDYLKQIPKIHIHYSCTNTYDEIRQWKWQLDQKTNEYTDEPVPFFDDAMAALRYSIEDIRRNSRVKSRKRPKGL